MSVADIQNCEIESIRFAYPSSWQRQIERSDEGVSVSLQSQGVSFAILGIYPDHWDPQDLMEQALDSLREEHPGLEVEEIFDDSQAKVSIEANFISLDCLARCWLCSWQAGNNSLLVMVQTVEPEAVPSRKVFDAICASVEPLG